MATSGTIDTSITSWLTLRVKWVRNSVSGLKSNVTVTAQLVTSGGNISSSAEKDISLTINGTKYTSTCTIGISKNTTKNLFTKTVNITHDADGTKSFAIACTLELAVTLSGTYYSSKSVSGTATLNSIQTKSTFTRSGTATMGYAQTITITRQSSAFTHTLKYTWAGSTTTIATGIGTSYTWTPPVSMASKILNATSGSCTLTLQTYNGSTLIGTSTLSFTLSVPTKSGFVCHSFVDMGGNQDMTITRKSDTYKHKLYYTWSGETKLIAENIETSYTWKPPVSMAAKIPNATSDSCKLTLETYNGTALVGSSTLTFTLSVPASVVPTISAFTLSEDVSGLAAQFGGFVNTKSKIQYAVTAAGAQGSTIKSYSVSLANQKFTGSTGTTAVISCGAGTKTATVTVTDSRGRTATKDVTYTVYAYTPPTFKGISAKRCNADGTESDEGTCLKFYVSIAVAAVNNKNTATYSLAYKLANSSSYTALPLEASGYTYSETTVFESPVFSIESAYDVKFTATDYFATVTSVVELPTAKPMIDYKANHKGVGIGKVAEIDNMLDIGYTTRFYGGLTAMQIDSGADLNTYLTPNIYVSTANAGDGTTANYMNCPINSKTSFYLEVMEMGTEGQRKQKLSTCSKTEAIIFERFYYQSTWGEWICTYGTKNAVLWEIGWYMKEDQTAVLSAPISKQPTGIMLVWSPFTNNTGVNEDFIYTFIPKSHVASFNGCSVAITDAYCGLNKRLYIYDDRIVGDARNNTSGTMNGITYKNASFILRQVIGV